jgi:molybdate transport system substrate-binding protein
MDFRSTDDGANVHRRQEATKEADMKGGLGGLAGQISAVVLLVCSASVEAAEIAVLSTPTLRTTLEKIAPQVERSLGHKINATYATSAVHRRSIEAGAAFDVAILVPASMNALIEQGKIDKATRTDISRSAVGVAIRKGAPKPDLASVDGFKRALLEAKSISYSGEGASGIYFTGLLDRLGIAADVKPKLRPLPSEGAVEPVAKGEIDIAVITIANILAVPGAELAGLLPPELQNYTLYTAGVSTQAKEVEAAKALIALLMAPETTPLIEAAGMERVGK